MCVVSMVGDYFTDRWRQVPWIDPGSPYSPANPGPGIYPTSPNTIPFTPPAAPTDGTSPLVNIFGNLGPTKQEFEELKKEVMEMKELLKRAVAYDKANNEPDCQMEEKVQLLRKVAELVGVSLDDVFGHKK